MSNPTLGNPPLALTLAQVKFNTVPTMGSYSKKIQDDFRKQLGFIHHDFEETSTIKVSPQRTGIEKTTLWTSCAADYKTRLVMRDDFLVLETIEYPGFENFIPNLDKALGIVQTITEITHITRLGFRYINRIETTPEKRLEYYLNSQLLGFQFDNIEHENRVSRTEAIANSKEGLLRVHCMQFISDSDASKNPLLPPDLNTRLEVKPVITPNPEKYAFLDIDHFRDFDRNPINIDIPDTINHLDRLHQVGYDTFISGTTEEALQEWD
ncbi:MAG: TIGR04255 family protein [Candidatus Thiodiazotropha endolucinida]